MEKDNNKNRKIALILVIILLIVVVVGASFAYYLVTSINSTTAKTGRVTTADKFSVEVNGGLTMSLNLTLSQLMPQGSDVAYYSSSSGVTTTKTKEAFATVSTLDTRALDCTYTITVTNNDTSGYNNTINQVKANGSAGEMLLVLYDGDTAISTIDMKNATWDANKRMTVNKTLTSLSSSQSKTLSAELKLVVYNDKDQNYLSNSKTNVGISAAINKCTLHQ